MRHYIKQSDTFQIEGSELIYRIQQMYSKGNIVYMVVQYKDPNSGHYYNTTTIIPIHITYN